MTGSASEFHDLALQPHPAHPAGPLRALRVSGHLAASGLLTLDYLLHGELQRLRLPPAEPAPQRRDELWRHTCLELFASRNAQQSYLEFNFAPSGHWAAYRFDGYRRGQRQLAQRQAGISLHPLGQGSLRLRAHAQLPDGAPARWQLGPAAVIEADDGTLSYWAAAHRDARADFHAAGHCSIELVAAGPAPRAQAAAR